MECVHVGKLTEELAVLAEMYPRNSRLLGLNYNQGEKIFLRLRESTDEMDFLPREAIVATFVFTTIIHACAQANMAQQHVARTSVGLFLLQQT